MRPKSFANLFLTKKALETCFRPSNHSWELSSGTTNRSSQFLRNKLKWSSVSSKKGFKGGGMKAAEIAYVRKLDEKQLAHLGQKPFDDDVDRFLIDMGQILSLLPKKPISILDMGCGPGWTSWFFAKKGHKVLGVDICPEMIQIANSLYRLPGLDYAIVDYENTDYAESFDAVIFYDSLHHAENEKKALECAYRALKNGGVLILCEPGIGHHNSELAMGQVKKYEVTEKDMPPTLVIPILKKLGMRRIKVISRLWLLQKVMLSTIFPQAYQFFKIFLGKRFYGIIYAVK